MSIFKVGETLLCMTILLPNFQDHIQCGLHFAYHDHSQCGLHFAHHDHIQCGLHRATTCLP